MKGVSREWFGARTIRSVRVVLLAGIVLSVLGAAGLSLLMREVDAGMMTPADYLVLVGRLNLALPVVVLMIAGTIAGSDVSRGLVVVPILREGGRTEVWRSRWFLALAVGVAVAATMCALSYLSVGLIVGFAPVGVGAVVLGGAIAQGLGWACLGLGLGFLVRGPVQVVAIPMVLAYAGEPVVRSVLAAWPMGETIASLAPFAAATSLVRNPEALSMAFDAGGSPSWLQAAATFLVPTAAIAVAGLLRFRRADLSPRVVS